MSRWQFEIPTEAQARETLDGRSYQGEMYHDAIACQRRLIPVTTPQERAEARAYATTHAIRRSFPCSRCGRHCFPTADVVCFWCRRHPKQGDR